MATVLGILLLIVCVVAASFVFRVIGKVIGWLIYAAVLIGAIMLVVYFVY